MTPPEAVVTRTPRTPDGSVRQTLQLSAEDELDVRRFTQVWRTVPR